MKKRVLQFIGSFHQGGSERQTLALARGLKSDQTFDVRLATLNREGVLLADASAAGFDNIPEYPLTSFYNSNFVRQVGRCAKYLRDNEIDIIHAHDFYTNVFGMAAAVLAGTKVKIASKRETNGMRSRSQDFVEKIAFHRADALVANSIAVRDHLAARGIGHEKINVIHNGIDLESFDPQKNGNGHSTKKEQRLITLVANLRHDVKNVPMFVRAAKKVTEAVNDVHFTIAGEGELETELLKLANDLGIAERVNFIGRCDNVPQLLADSYVCVLTSTAEGFSNSILEYMAAGKPVVATNVGGAAEAIVHGETGYLVGSGDSDDLASKLVRLLKDEEEAKSFGERGRQVAHTKFSRNSQILKTLELYDYLLKEKSLGERHRTSVQTAAN